MAPRTPLIRPVQYFSGTEDVYTAGYGVFALNMLFRLVGVWLLFRYLRLQIVDSPDPFTGSVGSIFGASLIVTGLFMFGGWCLVAGLVHARFAGSETEDYRDALGVVGWSYAPNLVVAPLQFGVVLSELRPIVSDTTTPEMVQRELMAVEAVQTEPAGLGLLLLSTVWSVYILAQGIEAIYDPLTYEAWTIALLVGGGSVLFAFA